MKYNTLHRVSVGKKKGMVLERSPVFAIINKASVDAESLKLLWRKKVLFFNLW